jgi:hypothetical protein
MSLPLLGDALLIQMWGVPLNSKASCGQRTLATLTGYEQLSLVIVMAVGLVIWVAVSPGLERYGPATPVA